MKHQPISVVRSRGVTRLTRHGHLLTYVALGVWVLSTTPALLGADDLKLLISVDNQVITAPYPLRLTLHLHNSGSEAQWLYRRVQNETGDGSTAVVALTPVQKPEGVQDIIPGQGKILEWVGLPRPKLVRLAPGEDYEEKAVFRLAPALALAGEERKPLLGAYRLQVKYSARFSNVDEVERTLGVHLWKGEVASNTVDLEFPPPSSEARGTISGRVIVAEGHGVDNARVSLSNNAEQLMDQMVTGFDGEFSFTGLPLGLYWITARKDGARADTVVFRHLELTAAAPEGSLELLLPLREIYEPKRLFHKPVLLRVTDPEGSPVANAAVGTTWSDGTVVDAVKGLTLPDGTLALELIPGRHALDFKRKGCEEQVQPIEVSAGTLVDVWKLVLECGK